MLMLVPAPHQATAAMVTALLQSAHPRTLHAGAMVTNAVAYEQTATAMGFAPQRYHCEVRGGGCTHDPHPPHTQPSPRLVVARW